MKNTALLFIAFIAVPALADTISVSVPACFIGEFEALGGAVAEIRERADELCSQANGRQLTPLIGQTSVEQTAPCQGFEISAVVECVPADGDQ